MMAQHQCHRENKGVCSTMVHGGRESWRRGDGIGEPEMKMEAMGANRLGGKMTMGWRHSVEDEGSSGLEDSQEVRQLFG